MKIVIIGQNGSGKTTLANKLATEFQLAHQELDQVWLGMNIPSAHKADNITKREIDDQITTAINNFINQEKKWVCEGFYGHALTPAADSADIIVFIDIPLPKRMCNHIKRMLIKKKTNSDFKWVKGFKFLYSMIGRTYRTEGLLNEFILKYQTKTITLKSQKEVHEWLTKLV